MLDNELKLVLYTGEKPAEAQTSIRLASHLARAPCSQSGGQEFESPVWTWTRHSDNIENLWDTIFYNPILKRFDLKKSLFRLLWIIEQNSPISHHRKDSPRKFKNHCTLHEGGGGVKCVNWIGFSGVTFGPPRPCVGPRECWADRPGSILPQFCSMQCRIIHWKLRAGDKPK